MILCTWLLLCAALAVIMMKKKASQTFQGIEDLAKEEDFRPLQSLKVKLEYLGLGYDWLKWSHRLIATFMGLGFAIIFFTIRDAKQDIKQDMQKLESRLDSRIDKLESRIDKIDSKLDLLLQKQAGTSRR